MTALLKYQEKFQQIVEIQAVSQYNDYLPIGLYQLTISMCMCMYVHSSQLCHIQKLQVQENNLHGMSQAKITAVLQHKEEALKAWNLKTRTNMKMASKSTSSPFSKRDTQIMGSVSVFFLLNISFCN